MKKLTLTVDNLRVQSFSTSPAMQRHGGTVKAHDYTGPVDCYTRHDDRFTDEFMTECGASCVGDTCPGSTEMGAYTCDDTCAP